LKGKYGGEAPRCTFNTKLGDRQVLSWKKKKISIRSEHVKTKKTRETDSDP